MLPVSPALAAEEHSPGTSDEDDDWDELNDHGSTMVRTHFLQHPKRRGCPCNDRGALDVRNTYGARPRGLDTCPPLLPQSSRSGRQCCGWITTWAKGTPCDTLKRAPATPMATEYLRARWQLAQREALVDRLLCWQ